MKVEVLYEDGKLKMSMGAKNVAEMEQLIHQFMDPIANGLGYEIVLKAKVPEQKTNSKFKEI